MRNVMLRAALSRYQKMMKGYPIVMNSTQTCVLMAAGDVMAQMVIERKGREYKPLRTLRMAVIGAAVGPMITVWYRALDRIFGTEMTTKVAIQKMLFVEIFLTPPAFAGIIILDAILEDKDPAVETAEKLFPLILTNWLYWPMCSFVIFRWVPSDLRVLWTAICSFGWNAIMSWVAVDQTLFAPLANAGFLSLLALFERGKPYEKLKEAYMDIMKTNYMVWPFYSFMVFKCIKGDIRTIANQLAGLFWNSFLSWRGNRGRRPDEFKGK